MTTNLAVDLGELFVMPQVRVRPKRKKEAGGSEDGTGETELMTLSAARERFAGTRGSEQGGDNAAEEIEPINALELAKAQRRGVIVGAPGAGKSTFLEWLQLRVAGVLEEEEFILGDQQAIPLLLRVRQLDPMNLPNGPALIEKATASKDRAALMPDGWAG